MSQTTDAVPLGRVVGYNVRRLRFRQGLTMDSMSRAARDLGYHLSASRINNIQRGVSHPKLSTLIVLARVLRCDLAELMRTTASKIDLGDAIVPTNSLVGSLIGVRFMAVEPTPGGNFDIK